MSPGISSLFTRNMMKQLRSGMYTVGYLNIQWNVLLTPSCVAWRHQMGCRRVTLWTIHHGLTSQKRPCHTICKRMYEISGITPVVGQLVRRNLSHLSTEFLTLPMQPDAFTVAHESNTRWMIIFDTKCFQKIIIGKNQGDLLNLI